MGVCASQPGQTTLSEEDRRIGAVVGSLCSDAATMTTHYIYEAEKMKEITNENPSPFFLEESKCSVYKIQTGSFSSYGDQAYVLLKSIVESNGFNQEHYAKSLYERFGPDTIYDYDKTLGHEPTKEDYPIAGGWRDKSIREFLKNYEAKAEKTGIQEDPQSDGVAKVAPLVALYAGNRDLMLQEVEKVVRVTQEDDTAVNCALAAAIIMEQCILGKTFLQAVEDAMKSCNEAVKNHLQKAVDEKAKDHTEFVKEVGPSSSMPGNLANSVHCLLHTDEVTFEETILRTLVAGGCNCSRSMLIGGCLGAVLGPLSVPESFVTKTTLGSEVVNLARRLVKLHQPKKPEPAPEPAKQETEQVNQEEQNVKEEQKQEGETPKQEQETPKQEQETPKQEQEAPKQEQEAPKQEQEAPKQEEPKQEQEAPKQEQEAPKQEQEAPKQEEQKSEKTEDEPPKQEEPKQEEAPKQDEAPKQEEAKPETQTTEGQ